MPSLLEWLAGWWRWDQGPGAGDRGVKTVRIVMGANDALSWGRGTSRGWDFLVAVGVESLAGAEGGREGHGCDLAAGVVELTHAHFTKICVSKVGQGTGILASFRIIRAIGLRRTNVTISSPERILPFFYHVR